MTRRHWPVLRVVDVPRKPIWSLQRCVLAYDEVGQYGVSTIDRFPLFLIAKELEDQFGSGLDLAIGTGALIGRYETAIVSAADVRVIGKMRTFQQALQLHNETVWVLGQDDPDVHAMIQQVLGLGTEREAD